MKISSDKEEKQREKIKAMVYEGKLVLPCDLSVDGQKNQWVCIKNGKVSSYSTKSFFEGFAEKIFYDDETVTVEF